MGERRRSTRITIDVTIQLVGMQTTASSALAQPGQTIDVSEHGAQIRSRTRFEPGAEVMIHNPENLRNGLFQVIRCQLSSDQTGWILALDSIDSSGGEFWDLC